MHMCLLQDMDADEKPDKMHTPSKSQLVADRRARCCGAMGLALARQRQPQGAGAG